MRVLLAEDHPQNQMMIRGVLEDAGYHVEVVGCGADAVAAVAAEAFDIVLMDVGLPGMDGMEATQKIRALAGPRSGIPIVALTANAMKGDRERYLELGVTDYVSKPMRIADLIGAIERQRETPAD